MGIARPALAVAAALGCTLSGLTPAVAGPPRAVAAAIARAGYARSLCAPPRDTVAPAITSVSFGRSSIDLNTGSRVQTVRATASDTSGRGPASGVRQVFVAVRGNRFYYSARLRLVSGTPASGQWRGHFTVSPYAHPGTYSVNYLFATDRAGNGQSYPGYGTLPENPNALSLHPADNPTFTVTGTPATLPPRKPAGTLRSFDFAPSTVDTTAAARYVRVSAAFAGAQPGRVFAYFASIKRVGVRMAFARAVLKRSGSGWHGTVRIPRWLGKQTMQPELSVFYGSHFRPSDRFYTPDDLSRRGFPSRLQVISGVDRSKPTLRSVSFSPSSIDSTSGAQLVTVTAHAGDVGSGVRSIEVSGGIRRGLNGVATGSYPFASAGIGYQSSNAFSVRLRPAANGAWVGTTTVRRCVPSGTYKLTASVLDVAGNDRYYSTRQLAASHIRSTVDVTSKHGDVEAPYVYSATTLVATHSLTLDFSEGVANVNTSTLTVYSLAPRQNRYQHAMTISTITCYNGSSPPPVDCSGSGGLVTAAVLTVPGLKVGTDYEVYANLNQVTPQLVDGNRNPMYWNYRQTGVQGS